MKQTKLNIPRTAEDTELQAEIRRKTVLARKKNDANIEANRKLKDIKALLSAGRYYDPNQEDEKLELERLGIYDKVIEMRFDLALMNEFTNHISSVDPDSKRSSDRIGGFSIFDR